MVDDMDGLIRDARRWRTIERNRLIVFERGVLRSSILLPLHPDRSFEAKDLGEAVDRLSLQGEV